MAADRPSFSALITLVLPTCSSSQRTRPIRARQRTICGPTTITRQLRDVNEPPRSTACTNLKTLSVPREMTSGGGTDRSPQLSQRNDSSPSPNPPAPSSPIWLSLCSTRVSAAHSLPSLSLHRPRNEQIDIKNKMPYKIEQLHAAVDFQPLDRLVFIYGDISCNMVQYEGYIGACGILRGE